MSATTPAPGSPTTLLAIEGNRQRLDGGAMFGNAPKALWSRWIPPDTSNRIPLACRALLVREDTGRLILFDTGIGAFFPPKLRERYGVLSADHALLTHLADHGIAPEDIDLIVLSHLHFDHAGGLLTAYSPDAPPQLAFPRAAYVMSQRAYDRAANPHPRDRASFIPELLPLLADRQVETITAEPGPGLLGHATSRLLGPHYRFYLSEGHTPGLALAEIPTENGPVVFSSDLIPGSPWVHLPITMGYDRFPEKVIDEKKELLTQLHRRGGALFFTHDPEIACARVTEEDGRFSSQPLNLPLTTPSLS